MRVVSWNIHRAFGTDRVYSPERIAALLSELRPDIVALQEVDSSLHASGGLNQLERIAHDAGLQAVMGPTLARDYGAYGNAILTRVADLYPREINLSYRKFEPRGAISVDLPHVVQCSHDVAPRHKAIRFINTHFGLKAWERRHQVSTLLNSDLLNARHPVILAGDLNDWFRFSRTAPRLKTKFSYLSERTATFPARWPRFALDRILLSFVPSSFELTVPTHKRFKQASDHLPVILDFEF